MVKVRGQKSNRNTVKQTAENGQKISGDDDAAGLASLVLDVKNAGLRNMVWTRLGLQRQVACEVIPADHEHFESLA